MGIARRALLGLPLLLAAVAFLLGINWGLPSRRVDPFLFGTHPVWTGAQIQRLAPAENPQLGADVDVNPIAHQNVPVVLNQTDAQRAEIVRRYRLFSYQPDEMITFKSLARIRQFHGDPRLYQYGGLWIYPVGALLKAASMVRLIDLRADPAFYLDHPEAFGRFYVVARCYVVAWGLVGVWAVFWIARRFGADKVTAAAASICYSLMPVVVNMAHEAKPHLPGAVLILLAIIAGTKFVETKSWRWALFCGALCGAAFGMVLSALLGFVILPLMVLLVEMKWSKRLGVLIASALIGIGVYAITNPFVVVHLFGNPQMLRSNLGNSSAMYQAPFTFGGFINAIELIAAGATPVLAIVGIVGVILIVRRRLSAAWLIAGVSLLVLVQFVLLATGKPGEYARFALLPDIALGIAAVVLIGSISERGIRYLLLAILCISTGIWGAGYVWGFLRDSIPRTTRIIVAERIASMEAATQTMGVMAEPAPYCLPPVDLFRWKIVLLPSDPKFWETTSIRLRTTDYVGIGLSGRYRSSDFWIRPRLLPTPISWAAKPFRIDTSYQTSTIPATTESADK